MRFIKLALISAVAFYLLIWGMSSVMPGVQVLSRAVNIAGHKDSIEEKIDRNEITYKSWLTNNSDAIIVNTSDKSFYTNNLFNAERQENADTIYFEMLHQEKTFLKGGIGLYQLSPDSATVQLFYVFHGSWYKPWQRMAHMLNESKYGGQMDTALRRLKRQIEK